jgi:hypothetical protein
MRKRSLVSARHSAAAVAILAAGSLVAAAHGAVVFANFEDGGFDGFGTLSNSTGVVAFTAPTTGAVITPTTGTNTTKVLDLTASGFNGGLSSGADLGYDFVASGTSAAFLANDIITFNWEVPPSSTTGGFAQLFNVIFNAPGFGFHNVGGSSTATDPNTTNQNPPYTGQTNTYSFNYDAVKAQISANPSFLQFAIQTNNGGGSPPDFYFDNFTLSANPAAPEPASCAVLGIGAVALLRRRR